MPHSGMISTHYNSTIVNIKYTTFGIASAEVTTFAWSWDTDNQSTLKTIHECLLVKDALTDKNAYLRLLGFVNKCSSQEGEITMGMSLMCVQPVCDCSKSASSPYDICSERLRTSGLAMSPMMSILKNQTK